MLFERKKIFFLIFLGGKQFITAYQISTVRGKSVSTALIFFVQLNIGVPYHYQVCWIFDLHELLTDFSEFLSHLCSHDHHGIDWLVSMDNDDNNNKNILSISTTSQYFSVGQIQI
jgi:hypothetical protein